MRSVKVTVEVLGTGITQQLHGEISTSALDEAVRVGALTQVEAATRIVDKALSMKVCELGMRASELVADRLAQWIGEVEQKVEKPRLLSEKEARMIGIVHARTRVRTTHLSPEDMGTVKSLLIVGALRSIEEQGEEYVEVTNVGLRMHTGEKVEHVKVHV